MALGLRRRASQHGELHAVAVDRNARARILFRAEALDRRSHEPRQHGGCIKHSGLKLLRTLLFGFCNAVTSRCDPSTHSLAKLSGMARSTVCEALNRLEAAGLIKRVQRRRVVRSNGGVVVVQTSNAYTFPTLGTLGEPQSSPVPGIRSGTTTKPTYLLRARGPLW